MTEAIKFMDNAYTRSDLEAMTEDQLLELRNQIAAALGVAAIKQFKDHASAVDQTMKALVKYETNTTGEKPKKAKKAPKERKPAKATSAQVVKRPTRKMFDTVKFIKPFDGEEDRSHRSSNYWDGMMIIDAIEKEGTCAWDLFNWEKQGYVQIVPATDEEYFKRRSEWFEKNGREDPEVAKKRALEEREKAKREREAAREAKKAEKEAKKAEEEVAE